MAAQNQKIKIAVVLIAILAALILNIPVLAGYAQSNPQHVFLGFDFFDDFHNYSMYIYEAAHSNHLFLENRNNTQFDEPGRYFWPYFLLLGKIVQLTGLSIPVVFMASRAIVLLLLLGVAWKLVQELFENKEQQVLAYALIAFGTGFGWLSRLLEPVIPILQRIKGADMDYTLGYSTFSGAMYPLSTLAFALFLALFYFILRYHATRKNKNLAYALVVSVPIPFIHPPTIPLVWGILATTTVIFLVFSKNKFRENMSHSVKIWGVLIVAPILFGLYLLWALGDPSYAGSVATYAAWGRWFKPIVWPIGFGLLGLFALIGLAKEKFKNNFTRILVICWLVVSLLLALTPTGRKFLIGAHIPMALLASAGILWAFGKFLGWKRRTTRQKIIIAGILVVLMSLTYVINTQDKIKSIQENPYASLTQSEIDAMTFLEQQPKANVLSSYRIGSDVTWMTPHRAFLGHWGETLGIKEKTLETKQFFSTGLTAQEKIGFLQKEKITYIFYGQDEKQYGNIDPAVGLETIYQNAEVTIYKFNPQPA
ncbi:MAG: hypothetical protein V1777_05450 [Candidatus Micrarchaeota archaeon]